MFIGHFAVGFGSKAIQPRLSLGTLFLAAQFVDLLWPLLLQLGLETVHIDPGNTATTPLDFVSYPISHSLLGVCGWAVLLGGLHWSWKRNRKSALVIGTLVISHWLLDLLVHRPDLPLAPGTSLHFGLGLWNLPAVTIAVEAILLIVGVTLYLRVTRSLDRVGSFGLYGLIALLVFINLGSIMGPPPPSAVAVAWVGHSQWLIVAWAFWIDRHRVALR